MKTFVPLALISSLAIGFGAMSLPAVAATSPAPSGAVGPASSPYCDATQTDINDNSADISQRLAAKGYTVDSLEAAGGCLEAFVHKGNTAEVLRLDPVYLNPVGSQG